VPPSDGGGFDPARMDANNRPPGLVPRILARDAPLPGRATGFTQIRVVGVGGAGVNAVDRMIDAGLSGVDFVAVNTDAQALRGSRAAEIVQIGTHTTGQLGAGGDPRRGQKAASESASALADATEGADMVFIAAGMGGGTGTGAAPAIAEIASEQGALTVGVVTSPFTFEGTRRSQIAAGGIQALGEQVDALIVVHNDRLLKMSDPRMGIGDAFVLADEMLQRGVQGITDLILTTGIVNVDFADVRAVMSNAGPALMGVGEASGEDRAITAVNAAMHSPLLETSIEDARGVLLNVTASEDVTLVELNTAAQAVADVVADDANIIFGSVIDPRLAQGLRITLIATGCRPASAAQTSTPRRRTRRRTSRGATAPGSSPFTVVPTPSGRDETGAAGR